MTLSPHRNVAKKHFCPACDHFHHVPNSNVPGALGVCLLNPPAPFIVGMVPIAAAVVRADPPQQQQMAPVLRAYYPPVGKEDTCSQWTVRPAGEA